MKIQYEQKNFRRATLQVIRQANEIIGEYMPEFRLTLRQLYYQFVARGLLENTEKNYKRLGYIMNDARLAGLVDWYAIEDRTRNLASNSHWDGPEEIIDSCVNSFALDKWEDQEYRIEVWIEKEALAGVFAGVCEELDVPYFSCRGYTSQSEMWRASRRLLGYRKAGQVPYILHFGDHDPSGMDMTRDIIDRMRVFGLNLKLDRLALNMDQVEEHDPPPNPAKVTDSRFDAYVSEYGDESWELDALEPSLLVGLVRDAVREHRDEDRWLAKVEEEEDHIRLLGKVKDEWDDVVIWLDNNR